MDIKIAGVLAKEDGNISNQEFQDYVNIVKQVMVLEENIVELEERRDLVAEEFNWFMITQDDHFNEEEYKTLLMPGKKLNNYVREISLVMMLVHANLPLMLLYRQLVWSDRHITVDV